MITDYNQENTEEVHFLDSHDIVAPLVSWNNFFPVFFGDTLSTYYITRV